MSNVGDKSKGGGLSTPDNDRGQQKKRDKKPGEGQVPDFDKAATDPDTMKHDGP
ncbi:hypothetical protein VQ042_20820 [Aurantimonas sp. A2-1-M11]|uniref:hypothetical protein n=1 Tax=Aurantimonas sp. A2-1-M11 TaxID=3113712 RepID=UPI002F92D79F